MRRRHPALTIRCKSKDRLENGLDVILLLLSYVEPYNGPTPADKAILEENDDVNVNEVIVVDDSDGDDY